VANFTGADDRPTSRWSPDGASIAFTDANFNVTIADTATGELRTQTIAYQGGDAARTMEWVGNGRIAVVGYQLAGLFDATTGAVIWQRTLQLGGEMAVDPAGTSIVVSEDGSLDDQILSLTDGEQIGSVETQSTHAKAFSWSYDGKWLVASGDDDRPKLWDATARVTRDEYPEYAPYEIGGVWAPADDRVAITDVYDQRILVIHVTGAVDEEELSIAGDSTMAGTRWSPTGDRLAALSGGDVVVWNMATIGG
jgi:WD40 repeat protein